MSPTTQWLQVGAGQVLCMGASGFINLHVRPPYSWLQQAGATFGSYARLRTKHNIIFFYGFVERRNTVREELKITQEKPIGQNIFGGFTKNCLFSTIHQTILKLCTTFSLPSSSTPSLTTSRLTTPLWFQCTDVVLHIKIPLLHLAYVDYIHHIIYGDAGLCYVGGNHYFAYPSRWPLKNLKKGKRAFMCIN